MLTRDGAGPDRGWRRWAVGAALALSSLRIVGHLVTTAEGLSGLWRGTAVLLGIMLVAGERRRAAGAALAGGLAGTLAYFVWAPLSPALIVTCLVNTGVTSGLAYLLLLGRTGTRPIFESGGGVWRFTAAVAACALIPAATGALMAHPGAGWVRPALQGYGATLLTVLVLTPAVVILAGLADSATRRRLGCTNAVRVLPPLSLIAGASLLVFDQTNVPLTFLVAPTLLLAAFRLRTLGAVLGVAIVGTIASVATISGHGPFAAAPVAPADRLLLMQLFVACAFLSALPVATILMERERFADESHKLAERFRAVIENVGEVIFQIDAEGRWTYLNPAWEGLTGQPVAAALDRAWREAIAEEDRADATARIAPVLTGTEEAANFAARLETPTGPRWVELFARHLRDGDGSPAGATGTLRDVDEAKRREERATRAHHNAEERAREATMLASTDELTGLANRRAFLRQLDREIAAAAEFDWPLSVAMFDVDHFKRVNDEYGHAIGDRVLRQVAERAGMVLRGGDLVGRLGGEEFGILMPGATAEDAVMVAERLRQAISAPMPPGVDLPPVTVSVGLAERVERRSAERLLAVADEALYRAKEDGRNRVRISA